MGTYNDLLKQSFKSEDTEEWLDVHFTRPIGLVFALFYRRLHIHPNVVTVISMVLGVAAGIMFYFTDFTHNVFGVLLLLLANFHDSADGQLARLTNQRTQIGRFLDGAAGDIWFISIYFFICMRLMPQNIPFTDVHWGLWPFVLCYLSGIICHGRQSSLADYYRQIHLYFLKGASGSELDSYQQQLALKKATSWKQNFWYRFYLQNYCSYCRGQEKQTPCFQKFNSAFKEKYTPDTAPAELRRDFIDGSRPLMTYANMLTFNCRAITLYVACLVNMPWIYPLMEITVFSLLHFYMRNRHEKLSETMRTKYLMK
jgi:hypothetical protein